MTETRSPQEDRTSKLYYLSRGKSVLPTNTLWIGAQAAESLKWLKCFCAIDKQKLFPEFGFVYKSMCPIVTTHPPVEFGYARQAQVTCS
jgi:hypothetical protein